MLVSFYCLIKFHPRYFLWLCLSLCFSLCVNIQPRGQEHATRPLLCLTDTFTDADTLTCGHICWVLKLEASLKRTGTTRRPKQKNHQILANSLIRSSVSMNVKKRLWSLGHFVLFGVGFGMTCSGAYLVSLQTDDGHTWRVTLAYVITLSGFLATLTGVFWTICRSLRSKLYQRAGHERQVQVHAVQR